MLVVKTNYELAFHLNSNLEEPKVLEMKQNLENTITNNGGVISYSKNPERTRLSYEINDQKQSLFGYIQFSLTESIALDQLNEQLKLNQDVLRHLVVKLPSDLQKKQSMIQQMKMRERTEKKAAAKAKTPTPGESKELDKKLEDILENI